MFVFPDVVATPTFVNWPFCGEDGVRVDYLECLGKQPHQERERSRFLIALASEVTSLGLGRM